MVFWITVHLIVFYFTTCVPLTSAITVTKSASWNTCKTSPDDTIRCTSIPYTIPCNITKVELVQIKGITIEQGKFAHQCWKNIKYLLLQSYTSFGISTTTHLKSNCFQGLDRLEELHIINFPKIDFDSNIFSGLNNLRILDLHACQRLSQHELVNNLNGSEIVPKLQYLNISQVGIINSNTGRLELNRDFFQILSQKQIKGLDFSYTEIKSINPTALANCCLGMEYVNLSASTIEYIEDIEYFNLHLDTIVKLDLRYAVLPMSSTIGCSIPGLVIQDSKNRTMDLWRVEIISMTEIIYLDGICHNGGVSIKNSSVFLQNNRHWILKNVSIRDNHFPRLDMEVQCSFPMSDLVEMDLSGNGIEYINPGFWGCFISLKHVDMSRNKLNKMISEDSVIFSRLFRVLLDLQYISLASNDLTIIPNNTLEANTMLETIDLSDNKLEHFELGLSHIKTLREINLSKNKIHVLDVRFMKMIGALHTNCEASTVILKLASNPLQCSDYSDYPYIKWILKSNTGMDLKSQTCIADNHLTRIINKSIESELKTLCDRKRAIRNIVILGTVIPLLLCTIITIMIVLIKKYRRKRQQQLNMQERIQLIREGAEDYEFAVFLSYCNEDEAFVNRYVFQSLLVTLQELTRTERNLLSTGDINFRPGQMIHNETLAVLQRSSVVVIIVSNNYCQSRYCRMEFDQAYQLEKPIVLMFKGDVDGNLMPPVMRDLYKRYTRILWTLEDNEYRMKTTWLNVCTSILELVN